MTEPIASADEVDSDVPEHVPPDQSERRQWWHAVRLAGPIWAALTTLRYLVAAGTEYFVQPDHGRLAQGIVGLAKLPSNWDAAYFAAIARYGYFGEVHPPAIWQAFFPGYPVAMRTVSAALTFQVSEGRLQVAGALISAVCSLIAAVVVFRLAENLGDTRAGTCAVLMLMLWPSAAFLSAAYSESLYLALAVGAWWNAQRGRWWWAGLLCVGASLTRVNGVFLVAGLLVMLIVRIVRRQEPFRIHKFVAVGLGAAGTGAYLGFLWITTGDPGAWQNAQRVGWARENIWPWDALDNTLQAIRGIEDPLRQAQWIIDIGTAAFCLLAAGYMAYRRLWPELTLTVITVGVLVSSTNYLSIMRNTLTIFPLFVIGGGVLARRAEWFTAMVLTMSGVWMIATTALFTASKWVG